MRLQALFVRNMASFSDSSLPNLKISLTQDEDNDLILDETMEDASMERVEASVKTSSPVEEISIFDVAEDSEPKTIAVPDIDSRSTVRRPVPRQAASDDDIKNLHKTFGLGKRARLNAIHVRGVNEMSTDDIIDYFNGRGCADIEWINDYTCNVVWTDSASAAVAMLAVSKPISRDPEAKTPTLDKEQPLLPPNSPVVVIYSDHDEPMSEDEDDKDSSKVKDEPMGSSQISRDETSIPKKANSDSESVITEDSVDVRSLGVPVPPGPWRLGNPHDKAKALLMRFATRTDRKLPGAEKRSDYYLKYGNPNYGGMKGIISTSRKRKLLPSRQREPYRDLDSGQDYEAVRNLTESSASGSDDSPALEFRRPKKLRMRMYADDEAERKLKKSLQMTNDTAKSSSRRWSKESSSNDIGDLRSRLTSNKRHIARSSSRDVRHRLTSSSRRRNSSSDERHTRHRWREEDDYDERSSGDDRRTRHRLREEGERSSDDDDEPSSRQKWHKEKYRPNSSDDLRDKLDQLRKSKKYKQRSPLVIQVLSSANE